ncbi:hypothetical protein [Caldimonas taiwanensis]|uniref:hypothetical protein n=1 Tax=Caldimonas taiwanensis TaxID=307483 RepID=UPI000785F81C|nr:hypothetical protein [Caldimonas taiwanensis]
MRILGVVLAMGLAGCGTRLPQRVEMPVPVPCIRSDQVPQRPVLATDTLKPDASVYDKARAALAERQQLRGYVAELEAVIMGCSGVPNTF